MIFFGCFIVNTHMSDIEEAFNENIYAERVSALSIVFPTSTLVFLSVITVLAIFTSVVVFKDPMAGTNFPMEIVFLPSVLMVMMPVPFAVWRLVKISLDSFQIYD